MLFEGDEGLRICISIRSHHHSHSHPFFYPPSTAIMLIFVPVFVLLPTHDYFTIVYNSSSFLEWDRLGMICTSHLDPPQQLNWIRLQRVVGQLLC